MQLWLAAGERVLGGIATVQGVAREGNVRIEVAGPNGVGDYVGGRLERGGWRGGGHA
jgi:hypothetical protein